MIDPDLLIEALEFYARHHAKLAENRSQNKKVRAHCKEIVALCEGAIGEINRGEVKP